MEQPAEPPDDGQDFTLRAWDGDESVQADLVISYAGKIERAILLGFPSLSEADGEEVVAEAVRRFWQSRDHFDANRSLGAYLYMIAVNVARDLTSGHLSWQKSRNRERQLDEEWVRTLEQADDTGEALDAVESSEPGICAALRGVLTKLPLMERVVIQAYADAGDHEMKAENLGIDLGKKHNGGVPIPAGTIRQYKMRAKRKIVSEMRTLGYDLDSARIET